ncbi:hypothetical protein D3C71_647450 [compost metagenome]
MVDRCKDTAEQRDAEGASQLAGSFNESSDCSCPIRWRHAHDIISHKGHDGHDSCRDQPGSDKHDGQRGEAFEPYLSQDNESDR